VGGCDGTPQGHAKHGQKKDDGQPQNTGATRRENAGQKPVDPQEDARKRGEPERRQRSEDQARNDERAEKRLAEAGYDLARAKSAAGQVPWGNLPQKAREAIVDATAREKPVAWRKALEDYFRKLAESKK
jgi:hypothetical protein